MPIFALLLAYLWSKLAKTMADYYLEAVKRDFSLIEDKLRNIGYLAEDIIKELIDSAMESLYYPCLPTDREVLITTIICHFDRREKS